MAGTLPRPVPGLRHVSFDLDGTLVDSFDIMRQSWEAATQKLGISCGFERYRANVGLPFPKILARLGLSGYLAELNELYFAGTRALQDQVRRIDGAAEVLATCRARGIGVSIITSKPRANAAPLIAVMGLEVDHLICADDVPRGKPDPLSAKVLCERLELSPADVLYVGDMVFDFQFALNAGMPFVLFRDGGVGHLPANLCNPVAQVDRLMDLTAFLP